MSGWRYFAQRFDGTGNLGDFIDLNLPLQEVEISEVLSGHNAISALVTPDLLRLKGSDGRPVFDEWGACIWAESPSGEVYGGVFEASGFSGGDWSMEATDLSGVLIDTPFDDAVGFENVDPLDIFRFIWRWYQERPGCNLGITTDMTGSPIRLGSEYVQVEDFDQEAIEDPTPLAPSSYASNEVWVDKAVKKLKKQGFKESLVRPTLEEWLEPGLTLFNPEELKIIKKARRILGEPPFPPTESVVDATPTVEDPKVYQVDSYKLNWYTNHDLAGDIDDLAAETPFDWHLIHRWSDEGEEADLQHHFRLGYPRLGRIGENIHEIPDVDRDGEEYANDIIVLGNGEGAATLRGRAYKPIAGRMRRTKVITDQTLMSVDACNARAAEELAKRSILDEIPELELLDHPHAPVGAIQLGDEFLLEGNTGWLDMSVWVRCLGRTFSPDDDGGRVRLSVIRTDRLG
jgi:hypothetical protein